MNTHATDITERRHLGATSPPPLRASRGGARFLHQERWWRGMAGFTLMELTMTIVVTGLLAGFTAQMLVSGVDTYDYLSVRKEGLENSRVALQRIVKEVRQAMDPSVIQKATADSLRFLNVDNESVQIRYINQSILLNGQPLVDEVGDFSLSYFDGSGAALALPIADLSKIWRIRVLFARHVGSKEVVFQQDIVPRNFRN